MLFVEHVTPNEMFIAALACGLSMEFEWQQVSSGMKDTPQNSGLSQQSCCLDGVDPSSDFFLSLSQDFGDSSKCTRNYW